MRQEGGTRRNWQQRPATVGAVLVPPCQIALSGESLTLGTGSETGFWQQAAVRAGRRRLNSSHRQGSDSRLSGSLAGNAFIFCLVGNSEPSPSTRSDAAGRAEHTSASAGVAHEPGVVRRPRPGRNRRPQVGILRVRELENEPFTRQHLRARQRKLFEGQERDLTADVRRWLGCSSWRRWSCCRALPDHCRASDTV